MCLKCCKPSRKERFFQMARQRLQNEINIVEIIKSRRFFTRALRLLLSERQRFKMKEKSRYIVIDPDGDNSRSSC